MGGLFTQSGVILGAAAAYFAAPVPLTATLFSYLTGGNLAGLVICLFIFDVLPIRRVLFAGYVPLFLGVALLALTRDFALGAVAIGLCGFGAGVGLSAGAVILAKTFAARARAIAFLATDCTFSLSGYVFPAFAAGAIGAGRPWQSGYLAVAAVAAALLIAALFVRFPATTGAADRTVAPQPRPVALARSSRFAIAFFAAGLACYLCGQGAFLIWAPQDLHATLGLQALRSAAIVGAFWSASLFGLPAAALAVTCIPPRAVAAAAATLAVASLCACVAARDADAFFLATRAFGFTSTCLFKLMISLGSERLPGAPPRLVTFLLLAASVGGTVAPALSAWVVAAYGAHAGIVLALCCYAGTLAAVLATSPTGRSASNERAYQARDDRPVGVHGASRR